MAETIPQGFELIDCPACGGARFALAHEGRDTILNSSDRMRIVRCETCGLNFTNPRPVLARLGDYYPAGYEPHQLEDRDDRRSAMKFLILRRAYGSPEVRPRGVANVLAAMASIIRPASRCGDGVAWHGGGRLLDFGCGGGKFLRRMKSLGWDVAGIDFSSAAVESVRSAGIVAHQGTLPHPDLKPESFDVITMRQALEHVPNPRGILRAAFELLAPGGRIVIEVPHFDSWEIKHYGDDAQTMQVPRHLLHLTAAPMARMLKEAGYTNIETRQECRPSWMRKSAKQMTRPPGAIDRLLKIKMLMSVWAWILQKRGQGNMLIATAGKP